MASRAIAAFAVLMALPAIRASAHDIPRDVTVRAFARPDGDRLHLLVRLPLRGITDVEYPRRERDFVDLPRVEPALRDVATHWLAEQVALYEEGTRLGAPRVASVRMSLESDRSFASYDQALAHLTSPPLSADTTILWEQGLLDVLFEYSIRSDRSDFAIHAAFDRLALKVLTVLRFLPPGGAVRAYELSGDAGLVPLDPRWHQAALRFVRLGADHILGGADHLLFLLCLTIPFRRAWALVTIVTSFTVAHSITLIASAYGAAPDALWFPPLVETVIALSIVYMALENIVAAKLRRRWIIAFLFGLVHGFGFSFGLEHTLQFAGAHLLTSLLSFNVGVELGQILVIAAIAAGLAALFRFVVAERVGAIILSALVAHTGWHWMTERLAVLNQFPWPSVTAAGLAMGLRWLMVLVALAGVSWLIPGLWRPGGPHGDEAPDSSTS
jgi:hypothetical protein